MIVWGFFSTAKTYAKTSLETLAIIDLTEIVFCPRINFKMILLEYLVRWKLSLVFWDFVTLFFKF
jgi:hypothetical protein